MLPYEHVHQCGHGLKYLGIVTPDGLISYMHVIAIADIIDIGILQGPCPGRRTDAFMYAESGLNAKLRALNTAAGVADGANQYRLFGDKGTSPFSY
jgi:hypothetical protein